LAELLTVLAIIAVLAGLLFPVLVSVKSAALKTQCLSNMKQACEATMMYTSDYDDYFMPVNHRPGAPPNALLDRTWVQLVLPYAKSFSIFTCPGDYGTRDDSDTIFDGDLQPGDIYARYYTASMHVNMGYNYLYLSPIVLKPMGGIWQWISEPRSTTAMGDQSKTILFADTVWDRDANGTPFDGGNWLVVPPCRYQVEDHRVADTFGEMDAPVFAPFRGWDVDNPLSGHVYGGVWPWHSGRVNLIRVDGSAKSEAISQLSAGCEVRESWQGFVKNAADYMWDLH